MPTVTGCMDSFDSIPRGRSLRKSLAESSTYHVTITALSSAASVISRVPNAMAVPCPCRQPRILGFPILFSNLRFLKFLKHLHSSLTSSFAHIYLIPCLLSFPLSFNLYSRLKVTKWLSETTVWFLLTRQTGLPFLTIPPNAASHLSMRFLRPRIPLPQPHRHLCFSHSDRWVPGREVLAGRS